MTPCACCGAYSQLAISKPPALLAVCDVLVVRTLEIIGRRVIRQPDANRSRFQQMRGRPMYVAHTLWVADPVVVRKVLDTAWDVVPAMLDNHGCCGVTIQQVTQMLDDYVHQLITDRRPHDLKDLKERFESVLHIQTEVSHVR